MSATQKTGSFVYGPVPSRRLGRSLGVDVVPFKTCTYDCVYCQLGRTTTKTVRRRRFADAQEVVAQVVARLDSAPDVIALAGSGEPTLSRELGEVITGLKAAADVPVAVITNGSLLGVPDVQRDLAQADIVLPSLDAADENTYQTVNRPHASLTFQGLVDGMADFRRNYGGQVWLEVMILDGMNATSQGMERIAAHAAQIRPDRVQLNTVVRPPTEATARAVSPERLAAFAALFTPPAEIIAGAPALQPDQEATAADVLSLIARRPCTVADVATGLGIHQNAAIKALTALVERGDARRRDHVGGTFFAASAQNDQEET
jgi:wyosine [tRNA(Phe)-imidazoG37] synthetase (radical SAM superfamily)